MIRRKTIPIAFSDIGYRRFMYTGFMTIVLGCLLFKYLLIDIRVPEIISIGPAGPLINMLLSVLIILVGFSALLSLLYLLGLQTVKKSSSWRILKILGQKKTGAMDKVLLFMVSVMLLFNIFSGNLDLFLICMYVFLSTALVCNVVSEDDFAHVIPLEPREPSTLPETPPSLQIMPEDKDTCFYRDYIWSSSAGGPFRILEFPIPKVNYEAARKENKRLIEEIGRSNFSAICDTFAAHVQNGKTEELKRLVRLIYETHQDAGIFTQLDNILQFVHKPNFTYSSDEDTTGYKEYARFPVETIVEKTGDCECLAILAATLFSLHGYDAALILTPNHCRAGVAVPEDFIYEGYWVKADNGKKYFLCEATGMGWRVGDASDDDRIEEVVPV